jgi:hypothetical protein
MFTIISLLAWRYLLARSFLDITHQNEDEPTTDQKDITQIDNNDETHRLKKIDNHISEPTKEEVLTPPEHNTAQEPAIQDATFEKKIIRKTINILVPNFIAPSSLLQLTNDINEEFNTDISLSIVRIDHLPAYQDSLENIENYDIVLVPSHRKKWLQKNILTLPFEPSISTLFHSQIATYMREQEMTRLPYSLDPILTISPDPISKPWQAASRDDVTRYLLTHIDESKLPFWIGFSEIERKFVEASRYPLTGIQQRIALIINAAIQNKNAALLDMLNPNDLWDFRDVYTLTQKPPYDINQDCQADIVRCITVEDQVQISRDLLSQVDHTKSLNVSALPNSYTLDSVARWRVIPNTLAAWSEEAVTTRLRGYLQFAHEGSPHDWGNALSAFNNIRNQQMLDFQYTHISPYIKDNNLTILQWSLDDWDMWINDTPLLDVLMGEYNAGLWVERD